MWTSAQSVLGAFVACVVGAAWLQRHPLPSPHTWLPPRAATTVDELHTWWERERGRLDDSLASSWETTRAAWWPAASTLPLWVPPAIDAAAADDARTANGAASSSSSALQQALQGTPPSPPRVHVLPARSTTSGRRGGGVPLLTTDADVRVTLERLVGGLLTSACITGLYAACACLCRCCRSTRKPAADTASPVLVPASDAAASSSPPSASLLPTTATAALLQTPPPPSPRPGSLATSSSSYPTPSTSTASSSSAHGSPSSRVGAAAVVVDICTLLAQLRAHANLMRRYLLAAASGSSSSSSSSSSGSAGGTIAVSAPSPAQCLAVMQLWVESLQWACVSPVALQAWKLEDVLPVASSFDPGTVGDVHNYLTAALAFRGMDWEHTYSFLEALRAASARASATLRDTTLDGKTRLQTALRFVQMVCSAATAPIVVHAWVEQEGGMTSALVALEETEHEEDGEDDDEEQEDDGDNEEEEEGDDDDGDEEEEEDDESDGDEEEDDDYDAYDDEDDEAFAPRS